jgi:hypothetical protein
MSKFKNEYPDFASIEHHIRQAHAERSVAIAVAFADAIMAVVRGTGRLFAAKPAARGPVAREAARI